MDNLKAIAEGKFKEGYKTALGDVRAMIDLTSTPMGLFNETMLKSILTRLEKDIDDGHSQNRKSEHTHG